MSTPTDQIDQLAYDAGRKYFAERGHGGPDMETLWKRYGRKVPHPRPESVPVILSRNFPDDAAGYPDHWDFVSWQQGVVDACDEAIAAYEVQVAGSRA